MKELLVVLLIFFGLSTACHAQERCPYINAETTSGALGARAILSSHQKMPDGETCYFVAGQGKGRRSLYVDVRPAPGTERDISQAEKECANKPVVVHALGNEAWSCRLRRTAHGMAVYGRVRNQLFFVRVSGIAEDAVLQDKTALVAEQVANNLY